jgi:hypothetical protein
VWTGWHVHCEKEKEKQSRHRQKTQEKKMARQEMKRLSWVTATTLPPSFTGNTLHSSGGIRTRDLLPKKCSPFGIRAKWFLNPKTAIGFGRISG